MQTFTKLFALTLLTASGLGLTACGNTSKVDKNEVSVEAENVGPWSLNRDESGMTFITTKNNSVSEIGTFTAIDGRIDETGAAEFTIVVDSINTNNDIRDPRMRQYLFATDKHPYINVTANIDLGQFADMQLGDRQTHLLAYTLGISGAGNANESYVMVTRLGPNKILVENKAPVIIDAADFGLKPGVEKLRELANLQSIAPTVPVTFSLVFER